MDFAISEHGGTFDDTITLRRTFHERPEFRCQVIRVIFYSHSTRNINQCLESIRVRVKFIILSSTQDEQNLAIRNYEFVINIVAGLNTYRFEVVGVFVSLFVYNVNTTSNRMVRVSFRIGIDNQKHAICRDQIFGKIINGTSFFSVPTILLKW